MKRSIIILFLAITATGMAAEKIPGPLLDNLGDLHHPVTTNSKQAQRYFDQGLRWF